MNLNDIKKKLTDEDITRFMAHLGSQRTNSSNPNELIFQNICHHERHESMKNKLYYYKNSRRFYCYSHCSDIGDIYKLAGHVLNLDNSESVKYVLRFFDINTMATQYTEEDFGFDDEEDDDEVFLQSIKLEDIEVEPLKPIKQQKIMRMFIKYYCKEWLTDGITKETMDKYDIKFSVDRLGVIIPHHNINGEIVGIRIRNFDPYSIEHFGKYTPLFLNNRMYNHKLSNNLYGLDKNKEAIKRFKKVVVFEGEKSVLLMDTFFGDNSIAVAICGSNMNRIQMKMLTDLDVEEVILAFDKQYENVIQEKEWKAKVERLAKPMLDCGIRVSRIWDRLENGLLQHKDAPSDRGKEVYRKLVKERIEIKKKEGELNDKIQT